MADTSRVERIRAQVREAISAADQLIARVSDEKFKQAVGAVRTRITEHDRFFLGGLSEVNVVNVDMWLSGAELLLGGEYATLRYYEEAARARDYKIVVL